MKTQLNLFAICLFLICKTAYCDVIPDNSHYVEKCVKITNTNDYPEISFIGYISFFSNSSAYIVSPTTCLSKGYKFSEFFICAVNKTYISGKDINEIDFRKDANAIKSDIRIEPYAGYVSDDNPISGIEQFYKIIGFTKKSMVMHKWKEVTKFNNGKVDSIKTYEFQGETQNISQKLVTGNKTLNNQLSIELYPNPAKKNFNLKFTSQFRGIVFIDIVALNGKKLISNQVNKTGSILDQVIQIEKLTKGSYFVTVTIDHQAVTKKMIVK